jgi:predicted flavoprotein YhiN
MPSAGRKFLMAGRGGLNLTHSEPLPTFLARYREAMPHLKAAIEAFPSQALRDWSEALGQETFVGSSGRVFPKGLQGVALAAGVAAAAGLDGREIGAASPLDWLGRAGRLCLETPDGARASSRALSCWRLAAPAGRGWAPMGLGSIRSPRKASRYPGSGRPIAALR